MSLSEESKADTHSYIRTALIVVGFQIIKKQEKNRNLLHEVAEKLQPELKASLASKAEHMLKEYREEFLTEGLVKAVKDGVDNALSESKWTKLGLIATQAFGLGTAGLLLKEYDNLPGGVMLVLIPYMVGLFLVLLATVLRGR